MSGIPLPCYLRGFRMSGIPLPCYLRCFQAPSCPLPCYLRSRKLRVSAAYYVCTTKSRLCSHGSPRRAMSVLQESKNKKRKNTTVLAPRPRENPQRGYVCMSGNAKTRRFWHRANADTRGGVTFVCQKTQKHDGFGTAPTRKPAEG